MHKIIEIYSKITDENEKTLLVDYLERYELGVDAPDEKTQDFLSNLISKDEILPEIGPFSAYNGEAAGNWAYNNYNSYSSNYPKFTGSFGTDCTNFVSQALHVGGGKPKSGNWTITKKIRHIGLLIVQRNYIIVGH